MKMQTKLKRKDFDQFYDDFSDFSLSSPARKIRRLNAELPPIMEEDHHTEIALSDKDCLIQNSGGSLPSFEASGDPLYGDFAMSENQERAIVLFKPVNPLFQGSTSSPLSVTVDSDLISGFKNELYGSTRSLVGQISVDDDDGMGREADNDTNKCTAVVPWVPSQALSSQFTHSKPLEYLEAEGEDVMGMDIEQNCEIPVETRQHQFNEHGGMNGAWHQHHCMIPQIPPSTSAPISWFH